jgi:pyruvate dehydrogenase E1 component
MTEKFYADNFTDVDPEETQEWIEALNAIIEREGPERTHFILDSLLDEAATKGVPVPNSVSTPYINTIPVELEQDSPGDQNLEWKLRSYIRWNAMAMVLRAGKKSSELGGHIASFASSATLYDVGFNHFWHAPTEDHGGDLLYIQGHSSPGIYARAFLEGRLEEQDLDNFRQEVDGGGLSSYPHPWLMPEFWQFPTVSMGLGPLMAIYQARFMKYMHHRGMAKTDNRKVWAFMGDGEMDEPESLGAISLAGRESLDNLVFVVNCNLQRLDGPVRGNGKIIQELEGEFRGAGWNVIKVIWGSYWDPLLAADSKGLLHRRMEEAVDGEYQAFKAKGGAYTREHFFGANPELKKMVSHLSDKDIWRLNRGGHDPHKVYAAYAAAMESNGKPTVILAKTVKGYGMGEAGEAQNTTHQQKKMPIEDIRNFRDRFAVPIDDEQIEEVPYYRPAEDSPEMAYLRERRAALGGHLPARYTNTIPLEIPELSKFQSLLGDSGDRELSTTMVFVRMLTQMIRDKNIGKRIVPIVPDESRTFGMEGLFRQVGIYSSKGQLYSPEDSDELLYYKESTDGQILQEGINEAGAMSSWIAAATSYANHAEPMIPFFIYYSMFGFQRIGDLAWAAGDMRAKGFLMGGTAGRTTLAGEGLQHQDGHGHLFAEYIPNCVSYDPTFAYELVVIVQDGMKRMYERDENIFYYISIMNENYHQPEMPEGVEGGILKGMYLYQQGADNGADKVQLMGCGTILRETIEAAEMLKNDFGIESDIWSIPGINQLKRDGDECERWNMLHPEQVPRTPYISELLEGRKGPVIAATDYKKTYAEQLRPFIKDRAYKVLGTDGFGRSDTRAKLREFFEVDRNYIVIAALKALHEEQRLPAAVVSEAIEKYSINADKPNPAHS